MENQVIHALSDFALFLAVMKHKEAQECALSIILDEPDLRLTQVRVEDVILNKNGRRGIRLDAWALAEDSRQFATEMRLRTISGSAPGIIRDFLIHRR